MTDVADKVGRRDTDPISHETVSRSSKTVVVPSQPRRVARLAPNLHRHTHSDCNLSRWDRRYRRRNPVKKRITRAKIVAVEDPVCRTGRRRNRGAFSNPISQDGHRFLWLATRAHRLSTD